MLFPCNIQTLILFAGHTWAHHCCAEWCDGVTQNEEGILKFVDKAVVSGLSKVNLSCVLYNRGKNNVKRFKDIRLQKVERHDLVVKTPDF